MILIKKFGQLRSDFLLKFNQILYLDRMLETFANPRLKSEEKSCKSVSSEIWAKEKKLSSLTLFFLQIFIVSRP